MKNKVVEMEPNMLFGDDLIKRLEKEKKDGKVLVADIAPAVRVALGELFGLPPGENVLGKTVALLRKLGFDYVVETPLGADIATYYEALDVKEMLERGGGKFPIFNSCCIGWRMYAERKHPELLGNITIIASPQMTIGAVSRFYLAQKFKIAPSKFVIVGIMPCTLKKNETKELMKNGFRYVDYVVTTVELAQWAKERGLDLKTLKDEKLSDALPLSSRGGMVFGVSGGMMEAVIATMAEMMGEKPQTTSLDQDGLIRRKTVKLGKYKMNVAVVQGLANFEKIYNEIKAGKVYHFVEVMMCPYGCVGGPGQPPLALDKIKERGRGLVKAAGGMKATTALENEALKKLREEFLDKIERKKLNELIYFNR